MGFTRLAYVFERQPRYRARQYKNKCPCRTMFPFHKNYTDGGYILESCRVYRPISSRPPFRDWSIYEGCDVIGSRVLGLWPTNSSKIAALGTVSHQWGEDRYIDYCLVNLTSSLKTSGLSRYYAAFTHSLLPLLQLFWFLLQFILPSSLFNTSLSKSFSFCIQVFSVGSRQFICAAETGSVPNVDEGLSSGFALRVTDNMTEFSNSSALELNKSKVFE